MTQYSTFFIPTTDSGDAQFRLNSFLRGHRILNVERHAFRAGWGFCVEWMDGVVGQLDTGNWRKTPRVDYREVLDQKTFERFAHLRERRKAIAAEDGRPPFMILTDAQMAELAKMDEPTPTEMGKINGVGEERVKKFAERLLAKT